MTWDIAVAILMGAFYGWRRTRRLGEQVASLELRLSKLQQEHNALMIVLMNNDEPEDDGRMLS